MKSNQLDPKEYFERRAVDNSSLKDAIPELLKVIGDLRPLRNSERETDAYIENWRKSKTKWTCQVCVEGEIVEADISKPDMTVYYLWEKAQKGEKLNKIEPLK